MLHSCLGVPTPVGQVGYSAGQCYAALQCGSMLWAATRRKSTMLLFCLKHIHGGRYVLHLLLISRTFMQHISCRRTGMPMPSECRAGVRVKLEEIEACLSCHPAVQAAAVSCLKAPTGKCSGSTAILPGHLWPGQLLFCSNSP